jgi:hypothetical protein
MCGSHRATADPRGPIDDNQPQGVFSKSANGIAGVRPSPGAATTKLRNRHQSSETGSCKFIAVAGDGHTPHFENAPWL